MGAVTSGGSSEKTVNYERADAGNYPARCINVIELGTHDNTYEGETKKRKELLITWELSELMEDGRPFVVSWQGTNSIGEKSKLFAYLNAWRGKPFNAEELRNFQLKNILDKCCMLNISKEMSKKGKEYNKVLSIGPMPKGMVCIDRVNPLVDFGIGDLHSPIFTELWPWVQKIINESDEAKRADGTYDQCESQLHKATGTDDQEAF